jgi:hypothetical protein
MSDDIALVVIGDGRFDYLTQTLAALDANVPVDSFFPRIMVNDSGLGPDYDRQLYDLAPEWLHINHPGRFGMRMAVISGWQAALDSGSDYAFWLEEDFIVQRPPLLQLMKALLEYDSTLAEVTLRRQPWNDQERAWGNLFGDDARFTQRSQWVEHDVIFSLNPSLIPRRTLELGWAGGENEMMTRCREHKMKCAFWGQKTDEPDVIHIGYDRGQGWRR